MQTNKFRLGNCFFDNDSLFLVSRIFNLIADYESKIDSFKEILNENNSFCPVILFSYLSESTGLLKLSDILDFMKQNSIFCDNRTAKMFIALYDSDQDQSLNYEEFVNFIVSQKNMNYKRTLSRRLDTRKMLQEDIPSEVFYTLNKLLMKEIEFASKLLRMVSRLSSKSNYAAGLLFSQIAIDNFEFISEDQIESFLRANSMREFKKSYIKNIFNRMDINKDNKVTLKEFKVFFDYKNYSKISSLGNLFSTISNYPSTTNISNNSFFSTNNNTTFFAETTSKQIKLPPQKKSEPIEENLFVKYLNLIIKVESGREEKRKKLVASEDFSLTSLFAILKANTSEDMAIKEEVLKKVLNYFSCFPTEVETHFIFNRFKTFPLKNYLNFNQFYEIFVPKDLELRKVFNNRTEISEFKEITSDLISDLLNFTISSECELENFKVKLNRIKYVSMNYFFEKVKSESTVPEENITKIALMNYLKVKDVDPIVDRFDKNKDGIIDFEEFSNEMFPLSSDLDYSFS